MKNSYKVAGIVVLFNPNEDVITNINSYIDEIDILFAVDNSEEVYPAIVNQIKQMEKVKFISNNGNFGIARALNVGAEEASKGGYDFLLTMDQDSKAPENMVADMMKCVEGRNLSEVGLISPVHMNKKSTEVPASMPCEEILTVMTSGNVLRLNAFKEVGPFMEKLFIDHVDHEYCLRLNLKGYKVIKASNVILEHQLGEVKARRFFFGKLNVISHSPMRMYYKTRNGFYVANKYRKHFPEFFRMHMRTFITDIIKALLSEDRRSKLHMMFEGYKDYRKGDLGKR